MRPIESFRGEAFRELREASGTTVEELARRLGVTVELVGRWERGREVPSGHARELLDVWLAENPPSAMRPAFRADRECSPVRAAAPPLAGDALDRFVAELGDAWSVVNGRQITREFTFADFAEALAFVNRVGEIAEAEDHHPDVLLRWGRVTVTLWTHAANGLTEIDFIVAAKVERRYVDTRRE